MMSITSDHRFHPLLALLILACISNTLSAAPLSPDDATISGNLLTWLHDANSNYNAGTGVWSDSSSNGNDATLVAASTPNGNVAAYVAPSLNPNTNSLFFEGDNDELLATPSLNGGSGMSNFTIITVYSAPQGSADTRPVGIGSVADGFDGAGSIGGDRFNLATDPSIRKDNGNIGGGSYTGFAHPDNEYFIRVARMDSGANLVYEWFGLDETDIQQVMSSGGAFTTGSDRLFVGDVRSGPTDPRSGGSGLFNDLSVSEAIVYDTVLSDAQVIDIAEWLAANNDALQIPEPASVSSAVFVLGLLLAFCGFRRPLQPIRNPLR